MWILDLSKYNPCSQDTEWHFKVCLENNWCNFNRSYFLYYISSRLKTRQDLHIKFRILQTHKILPTTELTADTIKENILVQSAHRDKFYHVDSIADSLLPYHNLETILKANSCIYCKTDYCNGFHPNFQFLQLMCPAAAETSWTHHQHHNTHFSISKPLTLHQGRQYCFLISGQDHWVHTTYQSAKKQWSYPHRLIQLDTLFQLMSKPPTHKVPQLQDMCVTRLFQQDISFKQTAIQNNGQLNWQRLRDKLFQLLLFDWYIVTSNLMPFPSICEPSDCNRIHVNFKDRPNIFKYFTYKEKVSFICLYHCYTQPQPWKNKLKAVCLVPCHAIKKF